MRRYWRGVFWTLDSRGTMRFLSGHGTLELPYTLHMVPGGSTCALLIWKRNFSTSLMVSCGGCYENGVCCPLLGTAESLYDHSRALSLFLFINFMNIISRCSLGPVWELDFIYALCRWCCSFGFIKLRPLAYTGEVDSQVRSSWNENHWGLVQPLRLCSRCTRLLTDYSPTLTFSQNLWVVTKRTILQIQVAKTSWWLGVPLAFSVPTCLLSIFCY